MLCRQNFRASVQYHLAFLGSHGHSVHGVLQEQGMSSIPVSNALLLAVYRETMAKMPSCIGKQEGGECPLGKFCDICRLLP